MMLIFSGFWRELRFHIRWYRWFWESPNIAMQILRGWSKPTRDIIFERWLEREPKREIPVAPVPIANSRMPDPLIRRRQL